MHSIILVIKKKFFLSVNNTLNHLAFLDSSVWYVNNFIIGYSTVWHKSAGQGDVFGQGCLHKELNIQAVELGKN